MGLDKLQEKAVVRIIDDDDSMRKSWRFLIEGEGGQRSATPRRSDFWKKTTVMSLAVLCLMFVCRI